jgi:hypothetical protein
MNRKHKPYREKTSNGRQEKHLGGRWIHHVGEMISIESTSIKEIKTS